MVLKNKKKRQNSHNSNAYVGEDKISNLPDVLIHHILSLLPTKCAMSTCILSKRWKYLSNSIPTLNFHQRQWDFNCTMEEKPLKTQQFMNFLDTVLYLHEKPNIQKVHLSWNHLFDESRLLKWINNVMKRKVEELFLSGGLRTSFESPLSYFTCDSLTRLELDRARFRIPNTVLFPKLKILRLNNIDFLNGVSTNKLLSNCPILEDLYLVFCRGFKSEVLCITNLSLKNLCISSCYFRESTVKICAPNLLTINYRQALPADFVINSFPSLVEADIDIYHGAETFVLIKLFEKLSNVKLLKMSAASFQRLREAEILLPNMHAFNGLIHLEVSASFGLDSVLTARTFFMFLQLLPNLESIVFAKGIYFSGEVYSDSWSVDPKCSLLHLKSIIFNNFGGEQIELDVIKVFLKYAGVLEMITIVASPCLSRNLEAQTKAMRELLMFPRHINCVVKFLLSSEKI